ncbi:hypothetical protein N6B72_09445 [Chryseobacterium soli]|uniref:hypothetical protein n=1 Tax=Chryseobacterium soli TaxID=445961 RepID=UPI002952D790|nr:hypothetical protein [Chryseobacterium soli]MDV7697141.1 hypothetical protein [Chryseobacterium soli]
MFFKVDGLFGDKSHGKSFLLPQITQIFTDVCGLCLFVETGLEIDSDFLLPQIAQILTDVCGLCLFVETGLEIDPDFFITTDYTDFHRCWGDILWD